MVRPPKPPTSLHRTKACVLAMNPGEPSKVPVPTFIRAATVGCRAFNVLHVSLSTSAVAKQQRGGVEHI